MPRFLVLYYTRTGNTQKMADAVATEAKTIQEVEVELTYFVEPEDLEDFEAIAVGIPTYHHEIIADLKNFFEETHIKKINLKGKIGAAFGSYGWSGEAPHIVLEIMKNKFRMRTLDPPILAKYSPDPVALARCRALGRAISEKLMMQAKQ